MCDRLPAGIMARTCSRLHLQPHPPAGQAAGRGRGRIRARPLRPRGDRTPLKTVGEQLMRASAPNPPYAVFSDSLEVYGADWTPDLLKEFQKRRGYDLTPYLPALAGDIGPKTAAIRHDWGQTLTELCRRALPHAAQRMGRTSTARSSARRPTESRPCASRATPWWICPRARGSAWRQCSATRWASSASHMYGRPVTSSETWTWLHSPVFRATPLDMKAEADHAFPQGHQPVHRARLAVFAAEAGEPGWRFYAAAVFNEHNPWWIVMPDVTKYLQRVSWLMRQGKPANDVAIYLPTDDAWAAFHTGARFGRSTMDRSSAPS